MTRRLAKQIDQMQFFNFLCLKIFCRILGIICSWQWKPIRFSDSLRNLVSKNRIAFYYQEIILPRFIQNICKQRKLKKCIWSICLAKRRTKGQLLFIDGIVVLLLKVASYWGNFIEALEKQMLVGKSKCSKFYEASCQY